MIQSKPNFYLALILLVTFMILNFPYPHEDPYGEVIATVFNIPIRSSNGFHFVGITSLLLLIIGLFLLANSVEKYRSRFVLIAIIIAFVGPSLVASSFQKTFATGIYAVSYDRDSSRCQFEMIDQTTLRGECELPFENYSKDEVRFSVEFEKNYFEDDFPMLSLLNNDAPYEVKLEGHERKIVNIFTNIDVSNMENHIDSGEASLVTIIIKSGEKARRL
ncbi:hypothetical protein [Sporosarcina pasteurii]|uniref:Uncharacterized protein n=1 Tax=Sporosarcina pasteurii TaxID=1474 RepID=A0A380BNV5_SPOPA|nr:hypothetical protein [Sporosarcina pasteurii]MDS9470951.1 hypothetical protein [Sporosarcina pasteurii]QBQ05395.1 hypothetical protein E2C16_06785 [Sporosarcina pasteurii]SUJ03434.1 Uncharacterised protein [Sporosarcina pasteurii]